MKDTHAVIGLTLLLVVSVLAPFAGAVAAAPSGMVTVPDGQITEDVPAGESVPISAADLEGSVLADDHADTLEVIVTTPERADDKYLADDANVIGSGEVAIVLRDTQSHDGRDVAIDAGLLREALDSTPEMIYGTHSSGETWTSEATYEDGYLRFYVEKFSSNTVTFSGEFRTTGTFSDGSTVSYQLDDLDSASNVTVNLTGVSNAEFSSYTKTNVEDGGEIGSFAATETITDANVTLTGTRLRDTSPTSGVKFDTVTKVKGKIYTDGSGEYNVYLYRNGNQIASASPYVGADEQEAVGFGIDKTDTKGDTFSIGAPNANANTNYAESALPTNNIIGTSNGNISVKNLTNGETVTKSLGDIPPNTDITFYSDAGGVDANLTGTERTVTSDPTLQLNSNSTSYTGTLSDGETISRTINKDALQEGENTINVSLPDQSADAPTMQVEANISHDATSKQTVEYDGEKYSERYNISKTFASDRENAEATIPFEGTVTSIREVQVRENGGAWTTADSWSLDQTTLAVDVGSVSAGDTVTVRADGSKVVPNNGEIQVTDPAVLGRSDDPKIEVTSRSSGDFEILYSGTPEKERVHYAYNETWTDDSEYAYFTGNDQHFVAPNVEAGDKMRIGTIPVKVEPVSDDGDVEVIVTDPAQSDPQYRVRAGSGSGDTIKYTYIDAKDDAEYELYSETLGVVLDSGRANSPLTLTGTDDAGVVEWLLNSDSGGSTESDDDISVIGPIRDTSPGLLSGLPIGAIITVLGIGALGVFGVAYARGGREGIASVTSTATSAGGSIGSLLVSVVGWLRRHKYVSALLGGITGVALLATGAIAVPEGTVPAVFTVAVPIGAYLGLSALDRFSWPIWGVVTAISLIVGLVWFGVDLTGAFLNQQVTVILAVGGLYLLYQLIQAYRSPDSVTNFVLRGSRSSETNTETTESNRRE
ncbi:MFS transporter [Halobellus ruber]|uniref:Uncharacterized protein n=1 Tax=Halobellus ruber TaxID=2761102 RepID=A0A7J9SEY2_9EURY|nr:MFS transporter [Halobellus ruber]MBB6645072.1 hypothetical protein [Halobellus ruber]